MTEPKRGPFGPSDFDECLAAGHDYQGESLEDGDWRFRCIFCGHLFED